jgi:pimeloyl-ACP methyl ester carboxylesterase
MRARLLAVAALGCGCSAMEMERDRVLTDLQAYGCYPQTAQVGDDQVGFLAGRGRAPLVLVHGFGPGAFWQFHRQRYLAGSGAALLAPDLLWYGKSSSSRRDFSMDHQVTMILELTKKVGFEKFDILGISYGGVVAYELARQSPERVRRIVLVNSPGPLFSASDREAILARYGSVEALGRALSPNTPEELAQFQEIAYHSPPFRPGFSELELFDPEHRDERIELLRAFLEREVVPEPVSKPTLVIWGRDDPLFPLEIGERLAGYLNAQLIVIDDARHAPHVERHEEFNERVLDFVR